MRNNNDIDAKVTQTTMIPLPEFRYFRYGITTTCTTIPSSSTTSTWDHSMEDQDKVYVKRNKWWKDNKDKLYRKIRIRKNYDKK